MKKVCNVYPKSSTTGTGSYQCNKLGEERCISNLVTVGGYIVQVQSKSNLFRCIAFNHDQEKNKVL